MTQPVDLPVWATDANYPAGAELWSGTATRVAPSSGQQIAGATPATQLPAQHYNYLTGLALDHLAALVDMAALNFAELGSTAGEDTDGDWTADPPKLTIAGDGSNGVPYICAVPDHVGNGPVWRSRDGKRWAGSDVVTAGIPITGIGGRVNTVGTLVAVSGSSATARRSSDVGVTWAAAGTLPSSGWERVAWVESSGLWVAAGSTKVATSPDLVTWTTRTPSHSGSVRKIVAAPEGSGVTGCVLLPSSISSNMFHSPDGGITWAAVAPDGSSHTFADAVYSTSRGSWYVLTEAGRIFRATTPAGPWVQETQQVPALSWKGLAAFGRSLIIVGDQGHQHHNAAVSSDGGGTWRKFSIFAGHTAGDTGTIAPQWLAALPFDGRIALFRNRFDGTDTDLEVALSARAPFALTPI